MRAVQHSEFFYSSNTGLEQLLTTGQTSNQGVSAVPLDPYSTESIFKELQLPSSNTKVHLLRINPLKQDQPRPELSSPEPSSNSSSPTSLGKNPDDRTRNGDRLPNALRCPPSVQVASRRGKILVLQGEDKEDTESELEIERVSFEDQSANFSNNLERLMQNMPSEACGISDGSGSQTKDNGETMAETNSHYSHQNPHYPHHHHRHSHHKDKALSSSNGSTASSDNFSGVGMETKMQRRVSLESDPLSARDRVVSSELPQQVSALETQITAQVGLQAPSTI